MKTLVEEPARREDDHLMGNLLHSLARPVIRTQASIAALVARLTLAGVMLPHGAQKVFGWFGGGGLSGTMNFFTETMHIPFIFALAAILAESLGPIALALGIGTRVAALAIAVSMTVAVMTSHLKHGFFMNWFGNQSGEGFEYHLLVLGLCVILLLLGGGTASMDRKILDRSNTRRSVVVAGGGKIGFPGF
jgi:putative oxidoreductase